MCRSSNSDAGIISTDDNFKTSCVASVQRDVTQISIEQLYVISVADTNCTGTGGGAREHIVNHTFHSDISLVYVK